MHWTLSKLIHNRSQTSASLYKTTAWKRRQALVDCRYREEPPPAIYSVPPAAPPPTTVHTKGGRFNQVRLNTSESEFWELSLLHIVILSAVCTALHHCLPTELPHICTANFVLLVKRAKTPLLTVSVNFSGYFQNSPLGPPRSLAPTVSNALLEGQKTAVSTPVAWAKVALLAKKGCLH